MPIRAMEAGDLDAVEQIAAASPDAAAWSRAAYEGLLADSAKGSVWVAERAGTVAGFVCFRVADKEAELLNLAVHPVHRRQGTATELVNGAIHELARRGAEKLFLEVRRSNAAALDLYHRCGFVPAGLRPGYYPAPHGVAEDAILLSRIL